jgi:hypothetical protein
MEPDSVPQISAPNSSFSLLPYTVVTSLYCSQSAIMTISKLKTISSFSLQLPVTVNSLTLNFAEPYASRFSPSFFSPLPFPPHASIKKMFSFPITPKEDSTGL